MVDSMRDFVFIGKAYFVVSSFSKSIVFASLPSMIFGVMGPSTSAWLPTSRITSGTISTFYGTFARFPTSRTISTRSSMYILALSY